MRRSKYPTRSYSFSFSKGTCDNLRYFKETHLHTINQDAEKFILDFIKVKGKDIATTQTKRGRPSQKRDISEIYEPFNFSLKISTIQKIREYKTNSDYPSIDRALEAEINLKIPVRVV